MTRHRPRPLWIGPGRLPVAVCCTELAAAPRRGGHPMTARHLAAAVLGAAALLTAAACCAVAWLWQEIEEAAALPRGPR